tara:strand:+ start:86 stop:304 length:219 start_codon:yes stop_codon:yes gene_type:complete
MRDLPDSLRAVLVCQGVEDPQGDTLEERAEDLRSSWETITRSGLVWNLEGWMGRQARNLLADGVITLGDGEE